MRLGQKNEASRIQHADPNHLGDSKFILVKRRTRLEELVVRYNTVQQAKFYIERLGADFSDYMEENRRCDCIHGVGGNGMVQECAGWYSRHCGL